MPQIESLRIADAQGDLRFGRGVPVSPPVNISDMDFFRGAREASRIGVVLHGPAHPTVESLLTAADEAMYEAKKAGRNCIRGAPALQRAEGPRERPDSSFSLLVK